MVKLLSESITAWYPSHIAKSREEKERFKFHNQEKLLVLLGILVLKQKLQQEFSYSFVKWEMKGFSFLTPQGLL